MTDQPIGVVLAAGGLGTRVAGWSPLLPKEFRPVGARPGLMHVLDEVAASGLKRAVMVHHPYYGRFFDWMRQALTPEAMTRYRQAAGAPQLGGFLDGGVDVRFVAQRGRYADITSALNGSQELRSGQVCVAFCDNVDPGHRMLTELITASRPGVPAVLTQPFDLELASTHGVVVCGGRGEVRRMVSLVEKPDPVHARELVRRHGEDCLRLLLGRVRLTPELLRHLAVCARRSAVEPRLSLGVASYARRCRVDVVTTLQPVVDLGVVRPEKGPAEVGARRLRPV